MTSGRSRARDPRSLPIAPAAGARSRAVAASAIQRDRRRMSAAPCPASPAHAPRVRAPRAPRRRPSRARIPPWCPARSDRWRRRGSSSTFRRARCEARRPRSEVRGPKFEARRVRAVRRTVRIRSIRTGANPASSPPSAREKRLGSSRLPRCVPLLRDALPSIACRSADAASIFEANRPAARRAICRSAIRTRMFSMKPPTIGV